MQASDSCSNTWVLEQFVFGLLPADELESLGRHVEHCAQCVNTLDGLKGEDTLVTAMRGAAESAAQSPGEFVERLADKLSTWSAEVTRSWEPEHWEPTPPDAAMELKALLGPAQEPGELGRLGPYRVLQVLGTGGMGVVFRAEDPKLGRLVALKVISPRLASSSTARQRFLHEARTAAAIEHDHIVPVYHVGEERGTPFLALPLLKGETLEARLKREGWLPAAEVLRIGREIAEGLAAAHRRGLIHRDIKPANNWLETRSDDDGTAATRVAAAGRAARRTSPLPARVKILDFGLARAVTEVQDYAAEKGRQPAGASLTHTGVVLGTPAYMAPEQARGGTVDARADLFSLGAVLYRMATGNMPFSGSDATAVLAAIQEHQPASPRRLNPKVPARLSRLILALLAKTPSERPDSASAVAGSLAAMEQRGRRRWWTLTAAGLLAVLLAVAAYLVRPNPDRGTANSPGDASNAAEVVAAGVEFVETVSYDTGPTPGAIAVGDLNGDGKADLVVVNMGVHGPNVKEDRTPSTVSVFLGNGDGTFQTPVNYSAGIWSTEPLIADRNGDGKADLVVVNSTSQDVSVLLGNGDGTFQPAVHYPAGRHPIRVVAGDFNGDGKPDLVVANNIEQGGVSVLLGNGDGSFRPPAFYATDAYTGNVVAGDFNGDGRLDVVASHGIGGTVSFLAGNGDGTLQSPVRERVGEQPLLAGAADFAGDGKLDLAVGIARDPAMWLRMGRGDGTFRDGPHLKGRGGLTVIADFNGDGKADIVSVDNNDLFVHLGKGRGAFQSSPPKRLGFLPMAMGMAAGDFNGDGRPDLAVSVKGNNVVWLLLNRPGG